METLVLNVGAIPIGIVHYRRAITLVQCRNAHIKKEYEGTIIRSEKCSMPIPSVIQCNSNYFPKRYIKVLPFNRKNVYIRDAGYCQYCGKKVSLNNFTFDHVIPKCLGGKTCWENIVVSCPKCNNNKGHKHVDKFKRLLRKPFIPKLDKAAPANLVNKIAASEIKNENWLDYIYWNVILEP